MPENVKPVKENTYYSVVQRKTKLTDIREKCINDTK